MLCYGKIGIYKALSASVCRANLYFIRQGVGQLRPARFFTYKKAK